MSAMAAVPTTDELLILGRCILDMLRDKRSDAHRVGRIIDLVPTLADALRNTAEVLAEGRARVANTAHAIILIGYRRVERVVRHFLGSRYVTIRPEYEFVPAHSPQAPQRAYVDVAQRYGTF